MPAPTLATPIPTPQITSPAPTRAAQARSAAPARTRSDGASSAGDARPTRTRSASDAPSFERELARATSVANESTGATAAVDEPTAASGASGASGGDAPVREPALDQNHPGEAEGSEEQPADALDGDEAVAPPTEPSEPEDGPDRSAELAPERFGAGALTNVAPVDKPAPVGTPAPQAAENEIEGVPRRPVPAQRSSVSSESTETAESQPDAVPGDRDLAAARPGPNGKRGALVRASHPTVPAHGPKGDAQAEPAPIDPDAGTPQPARAAANASRAVAQAERLAPPARATEQASEAQHDPAPVVLERAAEGVIKTRPVVAPANEPVGATTPTFTDTPTPGIPSAPAADGEAPAALTSPPSPQGASAAVVAHLDEARAALKDGETTHASRTQERVEGASGASRQDAPAQPVQHASAQEPRPTGDARASQAQQPQPAPSAPSPQHEQAAVLAANRGLDVALKQQGGSVQMRLSPESLGALRVELQIARGAVAATLQASTPEARDLLSRNIDALRSALEAKGLSVERLSITLAPASHGGSSGHSFNTNSGQPGPHQGPQPQPGSLSNGQHAGEHDAGGERSRGFLGQERHGREPRDGRPEAGETAHDERLFRYRFGLHAIG